MAEYLIKSETLTGIANAIREKTGTTGAISVNNMATEIASISGGDVAEPVTAACSVVGQRYNSYNAYALNKQDYCGFNYSDWYAYCLQFTTPAFVGESVSLDFNLKIKAGHRNNSSSSVVGLRWALCTSDANVEKYKNTTAAVIEPNQLAVGRIAFAGLTSTGTDCPMSINTVGLQSSTVYYLFLWGDNSNNCDQDFCNVMPASNHVINLAYRSDYSGVASYTGCISSSNGLDEISIKYTDNRLSWQDITLNGSVYDFNVAKNTLVYVFDVNDTIIGQELTGAECVFSDSFNYVFRITSNNFRIVV